MINEAKLTEVINKSGFPFQIGVSHIIEKARQENLNEWEITEEEKPWHNEESNTKGYVDLILHRGIVNIIVECKKYSDTNWLFLNTSDKIDWQSIHSLIVTKDNKTPGHASWQRFHAHPITYKSKVCVQDKDRFMIENMIGNLVDAIEAFAVSDIQYVQSKIASKEPVSEVIYIPLIVTNAKLLISKFNPNDLNITDGIIDKEKIEYKEVDMLRFTKTIKTKIVTKSNIYSEQGIVTCIVTNVQGLLLFLQNLSINKIDVWDSIA